MEPKGSLPRLQVPATCLYPDPNQSTSSPSPHSHFLKIHVNIIFPSKSRSSKWSPSPKFPDQNPLCTSPLSIYATYPAHLILLDLITRIIGLFGEVYRSVSSTMCSILHSPLTSSLLGPNFLLSTLSSNTVSLHSSLNVSDQVSHPQKTPGKTTGLVT